MSEIVKTFYENVNEREDFAKFDDDDYCAMKTWQDENFQDNSELKCNDDNEIFQRLSKHFF